MFLTANMSCFSSVFDVNVGYIENDNFNKFRFFSIFSNISVHVGIHINVDSCLNHKFYIQNLQSKSENNCYNFEQDALFPVFTFLFHHECLNFLHYF